QSVRILLSIRNDAPVTAATVATITSRGLATRGFTGYVYISLEDDGNDARPIAVASGADYPVIRTTPSRTVNLDMAIDQVNRDVEHMSRLLETQVLPQMQRTLKHVDEMSVSMGAFAEKINRDPAIIVRGLFHRPPPQQEAKSEAKR